MAQWSEDFSVSNSLVAGAGSSLYSLSLVSTPLAMGTQALRVQLSSGGAYLGLFSGATASVTTLAASDFELIALINTASGAPTRAGLIATHTSNPVGAISYATAANPTTINCEDQANVNSHPSASVSGTISGYYWTRLTKTTDRYRAHAWPFGASEPARDIGGATFLVPGSAALNALGLLFLVAGARTYYCNYIALGTAGDLAPRPKALDLSVNDGGTWKTVQNHYVRDGGVWKDGSYWVRDGGVWKKVYG